MYEMKLHDIGEGMTEGEVVQLLVQTGDQVQEDQPVMEVQTDKVCAELPSPVAGRVAEITVEVGELVSVGATILKIEESSVSGSSTSAETDSSTKDQGLAVSPSSVESQHAMGSESNESHMVKAEQERLKKVRNVMAAPYTRKMARDYGIEIELVPGTGPNGRITVEDVEQYVQGQHSSSQEVATTQAVASNLDATPNAERMTPHIGHQASQQTGQQKSPQRTGQTTYEPGTVIPFAGRRKQIASKMKQSMYTIPHVTHFDKIDMTNLLQLKEQFQHDQAANQKRSLMEDAPAKEQRVSIMAFVAKAIAISLKEYPIFNAKLDEEKNEIYLEPNVNLGVAVDSDEGLIVPVLPKAEDKSIFELNQEMKTLTKKAQSNELNMTHLKGGTFTMSNVGPIGGMFATPIINYPEVALLAFHQMEDMPVVRNKEIVIRSILNFSMSFDHRIADGVTAVQFTNRIKSLLENPLQLFMYLK